MKQLALTIPGGQTVNNPAGLDPSFINLASLLTNLLNVVFYGFLLACLGSLSIHYGSRKKGRFGKGSRKNKMGFGRIGSRICSIFYCKICFRNISPWKRRTTILKFLISNSKFLILSTASYLLLATPTYAQVKIGENFGFGYIESLGQGTSNLITPIFSLAGFLVLFYFLLAGFNYIKAGNDKQGVEDAKQMISHAIVGFVILMVVFLILQFLLGTLFNMQGFRIIG